MGRGGTALAGQAGADPEDGVDGAGLVDGDAREVGAPVVAEVDRRPEGATAVGRRGDDALELLLGVGGEHALAPAHVDPLGVGGVDGHQGALVQAPVLVAVGASKTLTVVNVRPLSEERARKTCRGVALRTRLRKSLATNVM